jgi:hypothetical protein
VSRYLLDTNTCIAMLRNHATVIQRAAAVTPGDCSISTITSYELHTGVEKCADPTKERAKVELLLRTLTDCHSSRRLPEKQPESALSWNREASRLGLTTCFWQDTLWLWR